MFEVLLVVIGVLVLIGLLLVGRSQRGGGDPSSSVDAFHRALSAMEPGARGGAGAPAATDGRASGTGETGDPTGDGAAADGAPEREAGHPDEAR